MDRNRARDRKKKERPRDREKDRLREEKTEKQIETLFCRYMYSILVVITRHHKLGFRHSIAAMPPTRLPELPRQLRLRSNQK